MNTGQTILTIGAMMLLGSVMLTLNRGFIQYGTIMNESEIGIYAISIATSIVEEASGQNYDEVTVNDAVTSVNSLTSTLGPESGESTSPVTTQNFDDFDDYNNLDMWIVISGVDSFNVRANVYYIEPTAPTVNLTSKEFHKRLDVRVIPRSSRDTIRTSYIFSYFNFR